MAVGADSFIGSCALHLSDRQKRTASLQPALLHPHRRGDVGRGPPYESHAGSQFVAGRAAVR